MQLFLWQKVLLLSIVAAATVAALILPAQGQQEQQESLAEMQESEQKKQQESRQQTWWLNAIVYQIYPRSFQDSDGDGVGDIKGIQSRLKYIADLGVDAFWLSPIYKSPQKDFGYDITDFKNIDPLFGTMQDFRDLSAAAKKNGLKIIMDFVPNHSSDQHEWFQNSIKRMEPYTDYYVWKDPKGFEADGTPIPPNNWVTVFRYSAWEFNEERQQFYLHQFDASEPDLNYRNPNVVLEMIQVLRFWMQEGVDGFRMDAVAFMVEDKNFPDEPFLGGDPDAYASYDHIYSYNLPETKNILAQFDKAIKEYSAINDHVNRLNMLEVYLDDQRDMADFYYCSDFPFNFNLMFNPGEEENLAEELDRRIQEYVQHVPPTKTMNWVLGNHDQWRVNYRFSLELTDAMNMISLTLPGVAITYNGEEIGMTNYMEIPFNQTVDPQGTSCGPDHYLDEFCSRDPERTPMQWSGRANAGFTDGPNTWLPVHPNYKTVNVDEQEMSSSSHLTIYKKLVLLRKRPDGVLQRGTLKTKREGEVLALGRSYNEVVYVTVVNFGKEAATINLYQAFNQYLKVGVVEVCSSDCENEGLEIALESVFVRPFQSLVLIAQF